MDERLKQRLVGAAVIGAALVIFVPMLLDTGRGTQAPPTAEAIPDWPDEKGFQSRIVPLDDEAINKLKAGPPAVTAAQAPAAEPEPEAPSASGSSSPPQPAQAPPPTAVTVPTTAVGDIAASGPRAWSVQLASFSEHDNAVKLRDELRAKGFTAFERTVVVNGRQMTRVFVGPELLRSNAESILKRLEQAFHLEGRVVTHPQD